MNTNNYNIFRYLVIFAVICAIAMLFPRTTMPQYKYTQGQNWIYEDLYSSIVFDIEKSEEDLKLERSKIKESTSPVFIEKKNNIVQQSNDLFSSLNLGEISVSENSFITSFLDESLNKGIVGDEQSKDKKNITLFKNNRYKIVDIDDILTQSEFENLLKMKLNTIGKEWPIRIESDDMPVTLVYSEEHSIKLLEDEYHKISISKGRVQKGDLVAAKGAIISESTFDKLNSYFKANTDSAKNTKSAFLIFLGYLILTCLIIGVLIFYVFTYFKDIYNSIPKLLFVLIWPLFFAYMVYFLESQTDLNTYIIPFCIVPMIIKNFYNERLALFTHIVVILIASFLSREGYEFTFLQILAGIVTILIVEETRYFNLFFKAIGFIFLSYVLGLLGLSMISEGRFTDINWLNFGSLVFNAILLLLAYPLIPMIEKIFGFVSSISLAELADVNRPLLREMTIKAPGTFQHSLQVANLAEAATERIGGDSLLVRVAALYHDIGKMKNPKCFIENLGSDESPHVHFDNFESAKVIIDHVVDGVKMAKVAKLPSKIIDFIETHHGTTRVEYFYRNQLNQHPDQKFDEALFVYPGPKPSTKEQAVLMIADSLEAASKSLKNPTGIDIDNLVEKIIAGKITSGQMDSANLSFAELETCKDTFKSLLRSINHVRVEYPSESE